MDRWVAALRDGAWFDARRVRRYAWLVVVLYYAPVLVAALRFTYGPHGGAPDFMAFWSAGRLAWRDPNLSWNPDQLRLLEGWTPGGAWLPFLNPPPFLLLVAPLGLLPAAAAHVVWFGATLALYRLAVRRLLPLGPALAFTPVFLNGLVGQNGLLTAALLIGAVTQLRPRPFLAGLLFGALIVKPQIAVLVPVALLADRRWRAIAGAAVGALGLLAISLATLGPGAFRAFMAATAVGSFNLQSGANSLKMQSVFASVIAAGGAPPVAWSAQIAVTACMGALVFAVWRRPGDVLGKGALLAAATPLASPYVFNYDLAVLALPIAWLAREGARRGFLPWERLTIAAAFLWPVASEPIARLAHNWNLAPVLALALVAAVLRRLYEADRTEPDRAGKLQAAPSSP